MCQTKLEKHASEKHSSLLRKFVNYGQKSFITLAPGLRVFGGNGPAFRKGKSIFDHTTHSIMTLSLALLFKFRNKNFSRNLLPTTSFATFAKLQMPAYRPFL